MKALSVVLVLLCLSGCGVKMGSNVVVGTTGFLEEVNKGQRKTVRATQPEQVARRDER